MYSVTYVLSSTCSTFIDESIQNKLTSQDLGTPISNITCLACYTKNLQAVQAPPFRFLAGKSKRLFKIPIVELRAETSESETDVENMPSVLNMFNAFRVLREVFSNAAA